LPFGRAAIGSLVLYGVSNLLSLLTAVWLANLLGVDGYGVYSYAIAWANVLVVPAALGLDRFVVRGVATYHASEDSSAMAGLLRFATRAVLLASAAVVAVALIAGAALLPSSLRETFLISTALIPIFALTLVRQAALQGLHHVVVGQLPEFLLRPALLLVGIAVCALIGGAADGPEGIMIATLAASLAAFLVGAAILLRYLPAGVRAARARARSGEWLRAALPMMFIGGIWLLNPYISTVILGSLSNQADVGLFTVASRGAALVLLPLWAVNAALSPRIARVAASDPGRSPASMATLQAVSTNGARWALAAALPIALVLIILRGPLLDVFGSEFEDAALPLVLLVAGQTLNVASGPNGPLLLMSGHERAAAWVVGGGVLLNAALNLVMVPLWGVNGCAVATAFSNVAWNLGLVVAAVRLLGIDPSALGLRPRRPAPRSAMGGR
jgi:O-antigen/teichoic acid export membrane protein